MTHLTPEAAFVIVLVNILVIAGGVPYVIDYPTATELQDPQTDIVSPCYYFCGHWSTWVATWLAAVFATILAFQYRDKVKQVRNGNK